MCLSPSVIPGLSTDSLLLKKSPFKTHKKISTISKLPYLVSAISFDKRYRFNCSRTLFIEFTLTATRLTNIPFFSRRNQSLYPRKMSIERELNLDQHLSSKPLRLKTHKPRGLTFSLCEVLFLYHFQSPIKRREEFLRLNQSSLEGLLQKCSDFYYLFQSVLGESVSALVQFF